ncbi:uncharacterized protein LOC125939923 [Dermacentor silvarum]|uniref:uncharacterized protein LOC125939923 n=1 Tax=Dermacentor silvarum TaxID=543639 RepID=UPI002100BF51|nr:uncharacterized protein LOC125939923 [Dermacentor silvarum]
MSAKASNQEMCKTPSREGHHAKGIGPERVSGNLGHLTSGRYREAGVELCLEDNASEEFVIGSRRDDGKVYAGCGSWINEKAWGCLFSASTDSVFCRSAATVFWTPEQLKTRSVTGTLSNKARHLGYTEAKPALAPEKVSSLKALFAIYMGDMPKEVSDKRMKAAENTCRRSSAICSGGELCECMLK